MAHTILGVLLDAPTHGYSIKKTLAGNLPGDLGVNDGQLYPTLARLERLGWIEKEVVEQRRSPTKHLYRVTGAGRNAFYRWLEGDEASTPARQDFFWRNDFLQRCHFFRLLDPALVRAQILEKLEETRRCEAKFEHALEDLERREPDPYRRGIVDYGIRYQRMRREWLQDLLAQATDRPQQEQGRPDPQVAAPAGG